MKISLNEIKKYVSIPAQMSTNELIELIGSRLVEVEGYEDLAPKYQGIYVVKVVECEPIPDTHLHLCQIDIGSSEIFSREHPQSRRGRSDEPHDDGREGRSREKDLATPSLVQVVCGAPNVHKGMLAVWISPGAIVPQTYGHENFKLEVRPLRGYDSHGMLAATDELDLGPAHDGVVEIDPAMAKPGDSFATVFDLNDIILDIENKSLTHRPDTFGLIGFAREVAGILGQKFEEPDFLHAETVFPKGFLKKLDKNILQSKDCPLTIKITDDTLCPRYTCALIELDDATSDSKYLTTGDVFLAKAGMHGISKIVDVTNILMLQTGQPLHAFDYDKFLAVGQTKSPKIIVRAAREGEELQLLDGKTIKCTPSDILITSNNVPVALAGAMGGANTEIDCSTRRVLLESASFSLYNLRKTQMHHGIFSEAITRFTKGVPASGTFNVLAEAVQQLGGQATALSDNFAGWQKPTPIKVSVDEINQLLGTNYDIDLITQTLENVGIEIEHLNSNTQFRVLPPSWRTDLHLKEDVIEEVGRLLGYDNIPKTFPMRPFVGATPDPLLQLKSRLRNILSDNLAAHELLTYSFVSQDLQTKVGEDPADSYQIVNSLSPELQCFRQSIIPSLLEKVYDNLKSGHQNFTVYEFNQVTHKKLGLTSEQVPVMQHHLGLVLTGDYYQVKANLVALLARLGLAPEFRPFKSDKSTKSTQPSAPYFEPAHSAVVYLGDVKLGSLGEIRASVCRQLKLPQPIAAYELDLELLLQSRSTAATKLPQLSRFPSVERDLTLKVPTKVNYQTIADALAAALAQHPQLTFSISPSSIYQKSASTRNLSFHLVFAHLQKTLDSREISAIMEDIIKSVQTLGVEVV